MEYCCIGTRYMYLASHIIPNSGIVLHRSVLHTFIGDYQNRACQEVLRTRGGASSRRKSDREETRGPFPAHLAHGVPFDPPKLPPMNISGGETYAATPVAECSSGSSAPRCRPVGERPGVRAGRARVPPHRHGGALRCAKTCGRSKKFNSALGRLSPVPRAPVDRRSRSWLCRETPCCSSV